MNLSLATAILDVNLKGPTATFDEQGLSVVRWAWETVKASLPAESPRPQSEPQASATSVTRDEQPTTSLTSERGGEDLAERVKVLEAALEPLVAQFDAYRESSLNHADAHNLLVRYRLWDAARDALSSPLPTPPEGE